MHILLTGSSGRVGSHTLRQLLARGYQVTALDIVPLPPTFMSQIPTTHHSSLRALVVDLTEFIALDAVFTTSTTPIDGIIHLSAIPNPYNHDDRQVHNNNVVANYNVLKTGAEHGVRRMVQASSVNAPGLSFPPEGHQRFDELPMDEETPMRPEDAYAVSKGEAELQATAMTRFYPGLRIASLRFHMCKEDYADAVPACQPADLYAWVSFGGCARACEQGLTSEGWEGHEVFNIVAPEICWEGGIHVEEKSEIVLSEKVGSLALLEEKWKGKYTGLREGWWEGNPRRSFWDCAKAERMLGWQHDEA